jgi:hypothetical protein
MPEKIGNVLREFFIDLLGSLIPGVLFMTIAAPLVTSASLIFWKGILTFTHSSYSINMPFGISQVFRLEFISPLLVLSYIMGSIFYRQDPKAPDQQSAKFILMRMPPAERRRHVIQAEGDTGQKNLTPEQAEDAVLGDGGQFPYSHLQIYLHSRGLTHLASMVPWTATERTNRTKMFINLLKIRLQFAAPEKCAEIIRNEAHVRMMSSVWYAAKTLRSLALFLLLQLAWFFVPTMRRLPELWASLIASVVMALSALGLQLLIRRFFHYQRVREIVYVLETYFVALKGDARDFLNSLEEGRSSSAASGA